jgi:glutathione synthase/RimK-type ligase-like ATP-grasp enzyme
LILELEARGANFVRFNTEDYPERVGVAWDLDACRFEFGQGTTRLDDIGAIWYRRPVAPEWTRLSGERAGWATGEALESLRGIWRTYSGLWVNHPDANELASSKLEQLRRARHLGFDLPDTVVTNESAVVQRLAERHGSPLICKPIRSGYIELDGRERLFFTSAVTEDALASFAQGDPTPYLFQQKIEKQHEFRVTVIGDKVFAVRLDSQIREDSQVDWRRGDQMKLAHTPDVLPRDTEDRCRALTRSYGLAFGAIDLALDTEGRYVFFEINPNGQWAWLEQMTDVPLRSALADLLMGVG